MTKRMTTVIVVLAVTMFGAILAVALATGGERDQRVAIARTALGNCLQIEAVKAALRATTKRQMKQIAEIEYYQTRPREFEQAQQAQIATLKRFRARDCYALPAVYDARIRRPNKRR